MCKMTSVMKDIEDITIHVIFPACVYISQYHVLNEWSCYFPKLHNKSDSPQWQHQKRKIQYPQVESKTELE